MTIQRSFRTQQFRKAIERRLPLLILAHHCAEFVNVRNRVTNAAIVIQKVYRRYLHVKIERLIERITRIQSVIRGGIVRQHFRQTERAAALVQTRWREIRDRKYRERIGIAIEAVTGFQAVARAFLVRQRVKDMRCAVDIIGEKWGWVLLGMCARRNYVGMRDAAGKIQRWWRDRKAMMPFQRQFQLVRKATVMVQAVFRGYLVRKRYQEIMQAAFVIQRWFRSASETKLAHVRFLDLCRAARIIQQRRRAMVGVRGIRAEYLELQKRTIELQRLWRKKKRVREAVAVLQGAWRKYAWVVRMRRMLKEVVIVQSLWRGWKIRKDAPPRVRVIRKRLLKSLAAEVRDEERLSSRTRKGLELAVSLGGLGRGILQLGKLQCPLNFVEEKHAANVVRIHDETFNGMFRDAGARPANVVSDSSKHRRVCEAAVQIDIFHSSTKP